MVANHTSLKKWRKQDDYTPGGVNKRPDRALITYTNLIKHHFKNSKPIVLGGLEASLRRIAHYDYWDNSVRRSILFDSKADILAFGMAEKSTLELARALRSGSEWKNIRGLCYISDSADPELLELPSYESSRDSKPVFMEMFLKFYKNCDDTAKGFCQKHGERYLIHRPPHPAPTTAELDEIFDLDFERDAHPYYKNKGEIRALETIKYSLTSHIGCYGQCSFCSIAPHQGRKIVSRSEESIIREAEKIAAMPGFNWIISDVGGPTANMYASECLKGGTPCRDKKCLFPQPCEKLKFGHAEQIKLYNRILQIPRVKKVFISSGLRHDMVVADRAHGKAYLAQIVKNHTSGQLKVAPEHYDNYVLSLMNKPGTKPLLAFKSMFDEECRKLGRSYFLTYYLIAAHPGCTMAHMFKLRDFFKGGMRARPEQVQIFAPTPMALSTAMYHCGTDTEGRKIFVERFDNGKQKQKDVIRGPAFRRGGR